MEEMLGRTGRKVLRKLLRAENVLCFELAKREGKEIALERAETRAKFKRSHRDLLLVLDFLEAALSSPLPKIVEAISDENRPATAERLRKAAQFLATLSSALTKQCSH